MTLGANTDGATHAGFEVAGQQTREFKVAFAVEGPHDVAGFAGRDVRYVGLVVFHVGVFSHHFGVFLQLLGGTDHDLVHHFALVFGTQAQGLAQFHVQVLGCKAHVVAHADGDGALGFFGVCGDAPRLLLFDHGTSGLVVVFVHITMGVGQ
jgi:hypothetical protein